MQSLVRCLCVAWKVRENWFVLGNGSWTLRAPGIWSHKLG